MTRRQKVAKHLQAQEIQTGSPQPGEPQFLAVGTLRRPHGVRGEIRMDVLTDFPERIKAGKIIYAGEEHQVLTITSVRGQPPSLLLSFQGFTDVDQVASLTNSILYVRSDEIQPLPDGEYYHHQLIGLTVLSEDGSQVGKLVQILETGANDVYVIQPKEGKEVLIPAIEDVILGIDLDESMMRVRLQDWSE